MKALAPAARGGAWRLEIFGPHGALRHRFPLAPGRHTLGAAADNDFVLDEPGISRHHARFEVESDGCLVVSDLGSKNGTAVAGERIERRVLWQRTRLAFGHLQARLEPATPSRLDEAPAARADRHPTLATSLGAKLVRSLRGRVGGGAEAAAALAADWLAELPFEAVEFRRGRAVVARAARTDGPNAKHLELFGPRDWSLVVSANDAAVLDSLGEGLALALEVLAAGAHRPAVAATVTSGTTCERPPFVTPGLRRVYDDAARFARGHLPLLLLGESGSGKEVLAAFVHQSSPRAAGPYLAINCAALPAELLEAELFGIEKGVATGVEARAGLLERASGGTLLLDEIGDLAPALQAKLLRVLEGAAFYRVGGRQPLVADVRFLAATHVDLPSRVAEGRFRLDLYYRLAAVTLEVPPLRRRREDVPLLAAMFFAQGLADRGIDSPGLTPAALARLQAHDWPGNVRELRHEITRAVLLLAPGEPLDGFHLREQLGPTPAAEAPLSLAAAVHEAERVAFRTALAFAGGDPGGARDLLAVSRTTFYRKLRELGLGAPPTAGTPHPSEPGPRPENGPIGEV
jgi:DNA-binding NtrC family response regulator